MDIDIQVRGYEYSLDIALTNRSAESITIYTHSLPWVGWDSMMLIAAKTDAVGTIIGKNTPIDDPGVDRITIKQNETLTGKISLVDKFPGFMEAIKDRDVIVFWSYQIQPIDKPTLSRMGGFVLFPKLLMKHKIVHNIKQSPSS